MKCFLLLLVGISLSSCAQGPDSDLERIKVSAKSLLENYQLVITNSDGKKQIVEVKRK